MFNQVIFSNMSGEVNPVYSPNILNSYMDLYDTPSNIFEFSLETYWGQLFGK